MSPGRLGSHRLVRQIIDLHLRQVSQDKVDAERRSDRHSRLLSGSLNTCSRPPTRCFRCTDTRHPLEAGKGTTHNGLSKSMTISIAPSARHSCERGFLLIRISGALRFVHSTMSVTSFNGTTIYTYSQKFLSQFKPLLSSRKVRLRSKVWILCFI